MDDMRQAARKAIWCVCSLKSSGGEIREAVIMDVSKTGVRVRFHTRGMLPERVQVKAGRIGLNRMARVAWQTVSDAGLEFIQPGQRQVASPSPQQPVRAKTVGGFGKKRV